MIHKNALVHHGVKGQKWGVRRFQRRDGSLTSDGKRRKRQNYDPTRSMSNSHLQKRVNRLSLENRYHNLQDQRSVRNSKKRSTYKGKELADKVLKSMENAVIKGVSSGVQSVVKKQVDSFLSEQINSIKQKQKK